MKLLAFGMVVLVGWAGLATPTVAAAGSDQRALPGVARSASAAPQDKVRLEFFKTPIRDIGKVVAAVVGLRMSFLKGGGTERVTVHFKTPVEPRELLRVFLRICRGMGYTWSRVGANLVLWKR